LDQASIPSEITPSPQEIALALSSKAV